ncbi:MAG: phosphoribosyl-ATP diphosphatase [Pseudomonadota bacterium]
MTDASAAEFLLKLEDIIQARLKDPSQSSYTARLASEGISRVAQKVGEEAVEVAIASVAGTDPDEVKNEAADLIYHLLLLLSVQGISLNEVAALLNGRHQARSGKA